MEIKLKFNYEGILSLKYCIFNFMPIFPFCCSPLYYDKHISRTQRHAATPPLISSGKALKMNLWATRKKNSSNKRRMKSSNMNIISDDDAFNCRDSLV